MQNKKNQHRESLLVKVLILFYFYTATAVHEAGALAPANAHGVKRMGCSILDIQVPDKMKCFIYPKQFSAISLLPQSSLLHGLPLLPNDYLSAHPP